eukprot:6229940-Amphidinium_carterae.1
METRARNDSKKRKEIRSARGMRQRNAVANTMLHCKKENATDKKTSISNGKYPNPVRFYFLIWN